MLLGSLREVLNENSSLVLKVKYSNELFNVSDISMEYGGLYFRAYSLLSDKEKYLCNIASGDEKIEIICFDFYEVLKNYEDDIECYFYIDDDTTFAFEVEVVDNYVVFVLKEN